MRIKMNSLKIFWFQSSVGESDELVGSNLASLKSYLFNEVIPSIEKKKKKQKVKGTFSQYFL